MSDDVPACLHCALPLPGGRGSGGPYSYCCFGCRIAHQVVLAAAEGEAAPGSTLLLRLGLGIFLAINIMVSSWLSYSEELFGAVARAEGLHASVAGLFSYLALFLATLVFVLLGLPLAADACRHLAAGRITTELLISVGVVSAFSLSAVHTFRGEGSLYYDTAAMVLVIVTLGFYLEAGARRRAASSASELLASLPRRVRVRRGGATVEVDAAEVRAGELVQVMPGATVPVDGRVVEGVSRVDEASLTGESRPRTAEPGDPVLAGTTSLEGQLWVRAERVGGDTVVASMERSLEKARAMKPPIQRAADRAAAYFVPAVVVLALAVFGVRAWRGDAEGGILNGLAVLLISCPCALGLAAPLASWHALRRAAEHGILIDSPATLEAAAAVRRVFFDKTGTLTRPELALDGTWPAAGVAPEKALEWAAGLESASAHPIARTLLEEAERRGIETAVPESASTVPGMGVEGGLDGRRLRLGSARWVEARGLPDPSAPPGGSSVYLFDEERVLARFDLDETPRPDAARALDDLRNASMEVAILSGDRQEAAQRLAERLGVPARGGLLPGEKVDRLTAARASGRVAMVGDGMNDAPVLAAADVGIALGSASDLAKRSGNVRLLSDRLDRIPLALAIARDARRRIRANLFWAFSFNSVGVALAAFGWLTPIFAAAAMVLSSFVVVRISSRAGTVPGTVDAGTQASSSPRSLYGRS